MLGEKISCATVSSHLYVLSYVHVQCYPLVRQLHSVLAGSPSRGWDVTVYVLHKPTELAHCARIGELGRRN